MCRLLLSSLLLASCAVAPPRARIAHLGAADGDPAGIAAIGAAFAVANPSCALHYERDCLLLPAAATTQFAFVQRGDSTAVVSSGAFPDSSAVQPGDLVVLRPGERLRLAQPCDLLVFTLPDAPDATVPRFVRPDWDPQITDTPGGCATEASAYRRILLTWRREVGPYVYHGLNAHRVRMLDSFTHYHPVVGGFDEFYLVQGVQPGARVLTCEQVERVERPGGVTAEQAATLLHGTELQVGDLVYLPRGVGHRGLGGVLAQVITVPGFVPGAEIGLDHHLRAIDERLGLRGDAALPYHEAASHAPVVR